MIRNSIIDCNCTNLRKKTYIICKGNIPEINTSMTLYIFAYFRLSHIPILVFLLNHIQVTKYLSKTKSKTIVFHRFLFHQKSSAATDKESELQEQSNLWTLTFFASKLSTIYFVFNIKLFSQIDIF